MQKAEKSALTSTPSQKATRAPDDRTAPATCGSTVCPGTLVCFRVWFELGEAGEALGRKVERAFSQHGVSPSDEEKTVVRIVAEEPRPLRSIALAFLLNPRSTMQSPFLVFLKSVITFRTTSSKNYSSSNIPSW